MNTKPPIKTEECECTACKSGMKTGHTVINQIIENQKSMNHGTPLNTEEKECEEHEEVNCMTCKTAPSNNLFDDTEEKCDDCYAHYPKGFEHKCDGLMKMLVSKNKEREDLIREIEGIAYISDDLGGGKAVSLEDVIEIIKNHEK